MTRAEIEGLVRGLYASRLTNDPARVLSHLAANAYVEMAGSPADSPIAGTSTTAAAVHDRVHQLVSAWHFDAIDMHTLLIDGHNAAAHYRVTARFNPTGEVITTEIADFITAADGKIVRIVEFVDTGLVARMAAGLADR